MAVDQERGAFRKWLTSSLNNSLALLLINPPSYCNIIVSAYDLIDYAILISLVFRLLHFLVPLYKTAMYQIPLFL